MADKTYLKDILQRSGPIDFEFVARGMPQQGTSKAGKPYQFWEYTVRSRSTGQQSVERLFEFDHKKFNDMYPGALMRASLNDKGYVQWDRTPTGEAALQQPNRNLQEVKGERQYAEAVQNRETQQQVHDFKLGLAGIVQAMIIRGATDEEITLGIEGKCKTAEEWVTWIRNKAQEMATRESFGDDPSAAL